MQNINQVLSNAYNEADKYRLKEVIELIVKLSIKANKDGLLSLENEYSTIQPYLLRKGIELIVEGSSPEDIKFIFNNYIQAKEYSKEELLEIIIIRDSILFIQNGHSRKILFEKIVSITGADFFRDFDYGVIEKEILLEEAKEYKAQLEEKAKTSEEIDFEGRILKIEDFKEMEKFIVKAGGSTLAMALKGCSSKLIDHIKGLCAYHIYEVIAEEMNFLGPVRLIDVREAQKSILRQA